MTVLALFAPGNTTTGTFKALQGQLTALAPPNNPPGNFPWIVVYNYSAYLLLVNIGSSQNWLEPATAASFPVPTSGSAVSLTATANPSNTGVNTGQIQAVWYAASDGPPVGFPLGLPTPLNVSNVAVTSPIDTFGAVVVNPGYPSEATGLIPIANGGTVFIPPVNIRLWGIDANAAAADSSLIVAAGFFVGAVTYPGSSIIGSSPDLGGHFIGAGTPITTACINVNQVVAINLRFGTAT